MANKITVTSAGTVVNANVTPDTAMYYSNKSKDWAISDKIVDNTDYSSKYYANESKKQADISTAKASEVIASGNNAVSNIESARDNAIMDVNTAGVTQVANVNSAGTTQINLAKEQVTLATNQATIATNKASEVVASGNTALSNITTAKNNAITSITNQETTSKNVLIDEGATQVGLVRQEGITRVEEILETGCIDIDYTEETSTLIFTGGGNALLSNYYTKTETNELIPTKTSQLTNDSGFITSSYHDSTKQDKLTAGDNITIVNNVISATGGGSGADIVQTTGNSTTAVMSQKATTDMPAFKEVVAPTKMFQAQNAQYCTSYDTFDYEDIKVAQVYCRQAYNSTRINHYRTGDIRYTSAISLYKDSKNYLSIYFNDYKLAIRNTKGGVVINEVNLGEINSGATNINLPANTAWCAETNLQEKTCTFYIMKNGELSVYGEVVDISTWDLSHLDTFNIVFGCSEYTGDSFCYYCLLNEKTEIEKIINTPIEYGKYNCYDTYLKNDIKPLKVTGIYADYTASNVSAGTLIAEYDNFHKVFSFSVPESPTPNYLGLYGRVQDNNHLGQICVIKCKFLEFAEGAGIRYAKQDVYIYEGTKFVYLSTWGVPLFVPELNVEYTFVIRQEKVKPDGRYLLRGVGDFTIEFLDMYYMVPQSANICAETWDGNFFRGTLPFIGTNILFSNNYSQITTSKTGLGVPQYYQTTDSNGNIYMYNGTTWKQISN